VRTRKRSADDRQSSDSLKAQVGHVELVESRVVEPEDSSAQFAYSGVDEIRNLLSA